MTVCGRYSQSHSVKALEKAFKARASAAFSSAYNSSYNFAPSQPVAAVRLGEQGRELVSLRWGLIPSWMKEPPKGAPMINARAETVASKPAFRAAYQRRRCLIPVDGFYEWQQRDDGKQPYYIRLPQQRLFAFAGLWEHWGQGEQIIESCTLITTDANPDMQPIHERMPVLLTEANYGLWLGEEEGELESLLQPYHGEPLEICPVSTYVNSPKNTDARCIEAV
jgi:putative SOS response-associated peptidase YedK